MSYAGVSRKYLMDVLWFLWIYAMGTILIGLLAASVCFPVNSLNEKTVRHYRGVLLISDELIRHIPFTLFGALSGILMVFILACLPASKSISTTLFWLAHPLHVLLSAIVTASVYRLHGHSSLWKTLLIAFVGSIVIATISDSLIPYAAELLLNFPHREPNLGFVEKWWIVNPLAIIGGAVGYLKPHTHFSHAGHVLLSTWASLFHIVMALGKSVPVVDGILVGLFLFLAVWLPCCTSDIVFPMMFSLKGQATAMIDSVEK